jgi:hypothetical protein
VLAQTLNIAILLSLSALFLLYAQVVFARIAEYQAEGLRVDNDLGQRGLALAGVAVFISSALAVVSIWCLSRNRVLGFLLHAFLWSVLLMFGMGAWRVFGSEPRGIGTGLLVLCLAGTGYGVVCAVCQLREPRSERGSKSGAVGL